MIIRGLTVTSSCTPVTIEEGFMVSCAATLQNTDPDNQVRLVAAVLVHTDGGTADIITWQLAPGSNPVQLPDPAGGTWVVATETRLHATIVSDAWTALSLTIGALAGVGFADLVLAGIGAWRRRRR